MHGGTIIGFGVQSHHIQLHVALFTKLLGFLSITVAYYLPSKILTLAFPPPLIKHNNTTMEYVCPCIT